MRDFEIREILRDTVLKKFILDEHSKVVDELNIPITNSRIDIAVVNGHLHGYEIKSSRDTLQRLPHQIEGYSKVFDYITVITEAKHHEKIIDILPDWIGMQICIESPKGTKVKTIRKPKFNKYKEGFFIAKLLWKSEVIETLKEYGIPYQSKDTLWKLCENLGSNVPVNKLSKTVRKKLKMREDWKAKEYYT